MKVPAETAWRQEPDVRVPVKVWHVDSDVAAPEYVYNKVNLKIQPDSVALLVTYPAGNLVWQEMEMPIILNIILIVMQFRLMNTLLVIIHLLKQN